VFARSCSAFQNLSAGAACSAPRSPWGAATSSEVTNFPRAGGTQRSWAAAALRSAACLGACCAPTAPPGGSDAKHLVCSVRSHAAVRGAPCRRSQSTGAHAVRMRCSGRGRCKQPRAAPAGSLQAARVRWVRVPSHRWRRPAAPARSCAQALCPARVCPPWRTAVVLCRRARPAWCSAGLLRLRSPSETCRSAALQPPPPR
jgi:hypothetical protein